MISYDDLINGERAYIKQMHDAFVQSTGNEPADTDYAAFCIDALRGGRSIERIFQERFGITPINNRKLYRLHVEGRRFVDAHGSDIYLLGTDSWCLFSRFANGENISAVLDEIRDLGGNAVATFSMADGLEMQTGITHDPASDPQHFDKVRQFNALASDRGLYVYWIAFATGQKFYPNSYDAMIYWSAFWRTLYQDDNTLVSLVNEGNQHINLPGDRAMYERPVGIAACNGSQGANDPPYEPGWDFWDQHGRRDDHIKILADADCNEIFWQVQADQWSLLARNRFLGESVHFAEQSAEVPHKRENNPDFSMWLAQCQRGCSGFWFLSDDTLRGQLMGPTQKECCRRAFHALLQGV